MPNLPISSASLRRLRLFFWVLALLLGLLYAWASRHGAEPDGISYLDMGDEFLQGHWSDAVNGLWSPLHGILLGAVLRILRPSPYWEFAVVHLVALFAYVGALAALDYFLSAAYAYYRQRITSGSANATGMLPEWAWFVLGYTLFIWTSFRMMWFVVHVGTDLVADESVLPDMLTAALIYLAMGLMFKIAAAKSPARAFATLGAALGLGYLARSYVAVLAVIIFGVTVTGFRGSFRGAVSCVLALAVVSAPFVIGLSLEKKRLTLGDGAKLNYAYHVDGVPFTHWPWEHGAAGGVARHPVRRILAIPAIYEFASPIRGTYPLWYDPSYWYDGIVPQFQLRAQWRVLKGNVLRYAGIFKGQWALVLAALFLFGVTERQRPGHLAATIRWRWHLLAVSLLGFAAFGWVIFEPRYVAPLFTLFWLGAFSLVQLPDSDGGVRVLAVVLIPALLILSVPVAIDAYKEAQAIMNGRSLGMDSPGHLPWEVARALRERRVYPGDRVAVLGNGFYNAYWARLARVKIVAEVPDVDAFWRLDPAEQAAVMRTLASTGAKVAVVNAVQGLYIEAPWTRLAETGYYAYPLMAR